MPTKLTDLFCENKTTRKPSRTYDIIATGLIFAVLPSRKVVWKFQSVFPGHKNQTTRTLGEYPALSLAKAREKAVEWRKLVKAGVDPADAEEDAARKGHTAVRGAKERKHLWCLCRKILRHHARTAERKLTLAKFAAPPSAFGTKPSSEITPTDIRRFMAPLVAVHP